MLTKEFLLKADCRTAFGEIDDSLFLNNEQRAASLAEALAERPAHSPVWVFGYGSLMWNPVFEAEEITEAVLEGWHRAFCMRLVNGRGCAKHPGRMLALKSGGKTHGLAFRLPEATLQDELLLLWKREMVTSCYLPRWLDLKLADDRIVKALVFIMNASHPLYESDICPEKVAPLIAEAKGPLGTNAQYLFLLEQELSRRAIHDASLMELANKVRCLINKLSAHRVL